MAGSVIQSGDFDPTKPNPAVPSIQNRRQVARRRKRRRFYFALKASEDAVQLPRHLPIGFLTQARLFRSAQAGDAEAKKKLWLAHARLAYSVANQTRCHRQDMADLIQASLIGLARAIDRFDVNRLNEFSTYAFHWLRQAARRHREKTSCFVPIPSYIYPHYHEFRRCIVDALTSGDWFDQRQDWLDRDRKQYMLLLRLHSLASPDSLKSTSAFTDANACPLEQLMRAEALALLAQALDSLSDRNRQVIRLRYGLDGCGEHTLQEVAQTLQLTRERVRQIQVQCERQLANALITLGPEATPNVDDADDENPSDPSDSHAPPSTPIPTDPNATA